MVALGTRGGKSLRNENTHVRENWVKRLQENAEGRRGKEEVVLGGCRNRNMHCFVWKP